MSGTVAAARGPRGPAAVIAGLTGVTLVCWILTARLMGGMDAGPGTPLGGFAGFLVSWTVMMAAMMLPAELRFTLAFAQFARTEATRPALAVIFFLGGYLLCWGGFGALAWLGDRGLRAVFAPVLAWDAWGPETTGTVLAIAGLYQVSRWKQACLDHCISPFAFFVQHWRPGPRGALRMGLAHGAYCIGCCWSLMLVLFALGIMSLYWMTLLALAMFAEKVLPVGRGYARGLALGLVVLGVWVAVAPATVPGLVQPGAVTGHAH